MSARSFNNEYTPGEQEILKANPWASIKVAPLFEHLAPNQEAVEVILTPVVKSSGTGKLGRYDCELSTADADVDYDFRGYAFLVNGTAPSPLCQAFVPVAVEPASERNHVLARFEVPPSDAGRYILVVGVLTRLDGTPLTQEPQQLFAAKVN